MNDKIQHPFMTKTLNKVDIGWTHLNIIKPIHDKLQLTKYSMVKSWNLFLLISGTKTRMPTWHFFQHCIHSPITATSQENNIESIQNIKKEVKLSLFVDDILYIENPKDSTKKPKPMRTSEWTQ